MSNSNTMRSKFNTFRDFFGPDSSSKDKAATIGGQTQRVKEERKVGCKQFRPQIWRPSICIDCFLKKEDHPKYILEEQLVTKEDPTELFEMIEKIGAGTYGSVYVARGVKTQGIYAVKFLPVKSDDEEIITLINEIEIMKQSIECPFVVEYYGCYMRKEGLMIVMEYCSCSLGDILKFCPQIPLRETHISCVCAAMVKGLAYLHATNVSHRDIKSGNVLIKDTGEVKLADFGASHKLKHKQDRMKTIAGSPYWCAPEVITQDSYDNKVDIWSMGIVALEMAEGKPPNWDLEPLEAIIQIPQNPAPRLKDPSKWSPDFVDFIEKCLQKNPEDRVQAKSLLCHEFVLRGSSTQLLAPLVEKCLPILIPKRRGNISDVESIKKQQNVQETTVHSGAIITVDKTSKKVSNMSVTDSISRAMANTLSRMRALSLTMPSKQPPPPPPKEEKKLFFGVKLEDSIQACQDAKQEHIVDRLISHIKGNGGFDAEGIFRISGNQLVLSELKQKFDRGEPVNLSAYSVFDVAALLKFYFRSLPESLFTFDLYSQFMTIATVEDPKLRLKLAISLVRALPAPYKSTLGKLLTFLVLVAKYADKTKMTIENISRCFGPNLLFLPENETKVETVLEDSNYIIALLVLMMENYSEIKPEIDPPTEEEEEESKAEAQKKEEVQQPEKKEGEVKQPEKKEGEVKQPEKKEGEVKQPERKAPPPVPSRIARPNLNH